MQALTLKHFVFKFFSGHRISQTRRENMWKISNWNQKERNDLFFVCVRCCASVAHNTARRKENHFIAFSSRCGSYKEQLKLIPRCTLLSTRIFSPSSWRLPFLFEASDRKHRKEKKKCFCSNTNVKLPSFTTTQILGSQMGILFFFLLFWLKLRSQ